MEPTRRRFLGSAAAVAAALGIDGFDSSLTAAPPKDFRLVGGPCTRPLVWATYEGWEGLTRSS